MSDISTQQKLQLARQVRERYQQDRQDLGQREQLLYGRTLSYFEEDPVYGEMPGYGGQPTDGSGAGKTGTLGLRTPGRYAFWPDQRTDIGLHQLGLHPLKAADSPDHGMVLLLRVPCRIL